MDDLNSAAKEFWGAVRDMLPLALGVGVYALAFGLLAAQAALSAVHVAGMGMLVFAGSSQIVATQQILAGAGAVAAVTAGIILNLRLFLITASIRDVFAGRPLWQKMLGAHLTTDESWALLLAERAKGRAVGYWYLIGGGATIFGIWLAATVSGVFFASAIPEPKSLGMDFAFAAAFIAIARSLWRGTSDLLPWGVAIAILGLLVSTGVIASSWAIILGGIGGAIAAALVPAGDQS